MNAIAFVGNSIMKFNSRALISRRSIIFSGLPPPRFNHHHHHRRIPITISPFNFTQNSQFHSYPFHFLGNTQNFSSGFASSRRLIESPVSPAARNLSTSVETRVKDPSFEKIYVKNGIKVPPLLENDEGVAGEKEVSSIEEGKMEISVSEKREMSEIEKEGWGLLEDAIVMYCGSPVGTLAANDPGDKLPLNYDQVFIRDFVPSALAFLLRGDGEIVRNFLLHTLQLQSWEKTVDNNLEEFSSP